MTSQPKYFDAQPCEATSPISYQPLASFSQTKPLCLLIIRNKTYNTHATQFPRHKNPARTPELVNKNKRKSLKNKVVNFIKHFLVNLLRPEAAINHNFSVSIRALFPTMPKVLKSSQKARQNTPLAHKTFFTLSRHKKGPQPWKQYYATAFYHKPCLIFLLCLTSLLNHSHKQTFEFVKRAYCRVFEG